MTDPINAGKHFDDAVRATSAFGDLRTEVTNLKSDVSEIKGDVKHIRTTVDRYAGAMVLVGSLVSVAVSLIVAFIK